MYRKPDLLGIRILPGISVTMAASISEFQEWSTDLDPKWKIFYWPKHSFDFFLKMVQKTQMSFFANLQNLG